MAELLEWNAIPGGEILLAWSDDHRSLFSPRKLREICPCASCIEEWSGRPLLDPEKIPPEVAVSGILKAGHYGIKISFSDGHATGIYSFDLLRRHCPCACCAEERRRRDETPPPCREFVR